MSISNFFKSLLFSILGVALIIISQVSASMISMNIGSYFSSIIYTSTYIAISAILVWLINKLFKQGSFSDLGISFSKINFNWFIIGISLPLLLNILTIFLNPGHFESNDVQNKIFLIISALFGGAIAPALVEELIFRGFMFTSIKKQAGLIVATILPSFIFAAIHILNGNIDLISTIFLLIAGTAAGIMFTTIRIATGNIWAGVVVHAFWDFLIANNDNKFLIITSNSTGNDSFFSYILHSNSLALSGGEFGIETSLLGTLLYILVSLIIYLKLIKKVMK